MHEICGTCHSIMFYFMKTLIFGYLQEMHSAKHDFVVLVLSSYLILFYSEGVKDVCDKLQSHIDKKHYLTATELMVNSGNMDYILQ